MERTWVSEKKKNHHSVVSLRLFFSTATALTHFVELTFRKQHLYAVCLFLRRYRVAHCVLLFLNFCLCRSDTAFVGVRDWTSATQSAHDGCSRPHEAALFHRRGSCGSPTHLRPAGHQRAPGSKSKPQLCYIAASLDLARIQSAHLSNLSSTHTTTPPSSLFSDYTELYCGGVYNFKSSNLLLWYLTLAPNFVLPKVCGWGACWPWGSEQWCWLVFSHSFYYRPLMWNGFISY